MTTTGCDTASQLSFRDKEILGEDDEYQLIQPSTQVGSKQEVPEGDSELCQEFRPP